MSTVSKYVYIGKLVDGQRTVEHGIPDVDWVLDVSIFVTGGDVWSLAGWKRDIVCDRRSVTVKSSEDIGDRKLTAIITYMKTSQVKAAVRIEGNIGGAYRILDAYSGKEITTDHDQISVHRGPFISEVKISKGGQHLETFELCGPPRTSSGCHTCGGGIPPTMKTSQQKAETDEKADKVCSSCGGSGRGETLFNIPTDCPVCGGTGEVK